MYCKYLCTFTPTFALGAECIYYMNVVLNYINLHYTFKVYTSVQKSNKKL